ncbi:MAG: hypothetical protein ACO3CA_04720 [Methylophilaceae bacterium]
MKNYLWLTLLFSQLAFSYDFTGHYQCEGKDSTEGAYQGEVIMNKKVEFTQEDYASYDFVLKVPGFGDYHGFAAANGLDVAIYFGLKDLKNQDYGVGIAKFEQTNSQQWKFHKFYFEPAYEGGNIGFEDCTQVK